MGEYNLKSWTVACDVHKLIEWAEEKRTTAKSLRTAKIGDAGECEALEQAAVTLERMANRVEEQTTTTLEKKKIEYEAKERVRKEREATEAAKRAEAHKIWLKVEAKRRQKRKAAREAREEVKITAAWEALQAKKRRRKD